MQSLTIHDMKQIAFGPIKSGQNGVTWRDIIITHGNNEKMEIILFPADNDFSSLIPTFNKTIGTE